MPQYPASTTYHLSSLTLGNSPAALQAVPFTREFFLKKKKKSKANPEIAEVDFLLSAKTQLHLVSDTGTHVHTYPHTPSHSPSSPALAECNQP